MSATNRGAKRQEADNYPTPSWCTRRILEAVELYHPHRPLKIFEPCAGDGAIVRELRQTFTTAEITANELRNVDTLHDAGATFVTHGDYLAWPALRQPMPRFDIGITNPPFAIAEAVVQQMLTHCSLVVVLVRQGFVGHGRATWMRGNMPDTYELPDRPSFVSTASCDAEVVTSPAEYVTELSPCRWSMLVPHGTEIDRCPSCNTRGSVSVRQTTDAADYCWLVWTPERNRTWGRRYILPSTPLAERKAG